MREYDKALDRLALSPLRLSAHTLSVYCQSEALMHGLTQPCMALSSSFEVADSSWKDAMSVYARRESKHCRKRL